jgi:hypothetical protein
MINSEKTFSHIKWFLNVVPIGILGIITAPILYPIAQLIEYVLPKFNPLWWWMDDEIDDPERNSDWLIFCNNKPNNIIIRYEWHAFRNTLWNLKSLLKPKIARVHCVSNDEEMVEVIKDDLWRNGEKVNIYGKCLEVAEYKWIDEYGNEGWQVNRGETISKKFSTIGEVEYWYRAHDKLYYRYSIAEKRKMTFLTTKFPFIHRTDGYFNFKMGVTDKGYLLVMKRIKI